MATHSSILAWIIPWTEAPGRLQSMGLQSQTQLSPHACRLVKGHFGMYTGKAWKRGLTFMALLPIAKTWKQPKYPLTDEWVSEMWGVPLSITSPCPQMVWRCSVPPCAYPLPQPRTYRMLFRPL